MKRHTRKRGGTQSKCISVCGHQCEGNCRNLCNVSKHDVAYHKYHYEELKEKKKKLIDTLENDNQSKIDDLLKQSKLSKGEQENLKKILTSSRLEYSPKQFVLKMTRENQTKLPFLLQGKQGGFNFLSKSRSYSECETDCRERCSESCEYLCGESVNKLSSMYKKEADVLESEISVLEEVQRLIRVV